MTDTGDQELYGKFLSGDNDSYDRLMLRYGDALVRFLDGFLKNRQDAEDLMIEAFARIMVKRPLIYARGGEEGSFKAYLYRTARNLATRFVGRRREFSALDEVAEPMDEETPEDRFEESERDRILHLCLSRIDQKYKEALWLVYCEGMSYAETAEIMGFSKKKVDKLLQTGKTKLKEELAGEGITDIS